MIRRTFTYESPPTARWSQAQILVTVDPATGDVHVASRASDWDTWSTPMPELTRDDDEPGPSRTYPPGGRTFFAGTADK